MSSEVCRKYRILPLSDSSHEGKVVLLRVDFNVPLDENNLIADNSRVKSAKKSIDFLLKQNSKVIIISHLGDPKTPEDEKKLSFRKIVDKLGVVLGCDIYLAKGKNLKEIGQELENLEVDGRRVFLLDNIRFFQGEKSNDEGFASELIKNLKIDFYVNDAFPVCHRAHASISAIPKLLDKKYAGFDLLNELAMLEKTCSKAFKGDVTAIVGGKKVVTKALLLQKLAAKVQNIIIVGGMANTFLKASGADIGSSFFEPEMLEVASQMMASNKVLIPLDVLCENQSGEIITVKTKDITKGHIGDIGPETNRLIDQIINKSELVIWNGPAGICEDERFSGGTKGIAESIVRSPCVSVIGGGDTAAIVNKMDLKDKIDYISKGGGAFIAWLENSAMPGIEALKLK